MKFRTAFLSILFFISLSGNSTRAQSLTIEQIMQGNDFVGHLPSSPFWAGQSNTLYFKWNPEGKAYSEIYRYSLSSKKIRRVDPKQYRNLPQGNVQWDSNYKNITYTQGGKLFMLNAASRKTTPVIQTTDDISHPYFAKQNRKIVYTRNQNLYTWDVENGTTKQLTNFMPGHKKRESQSAQKQWLKDQQLELFDIVNDWEQRKEEKKAFSEKTSLKEPKAIYTGNNRVVRQKTSPDLHYIFYALSTTATAERTKVPKWVNASGYVDFGNYRSKVGSPQPSYEHYILDVENDTVICIDTKQIPGIYKKPEFLKHYADSALLDSGYQQKYEKPRKVIMQNISFSPRGSHICVAVRSEDNKDRWLMELDPTNGKLTLINRQHDEAWIGGPNINGWNAYDGKTGWISDDVFWFSSEESGYSHLYTYTFSTGKTRALTKGKYEVLQAQLSKNKKYFYLLSNKGNPSEQHVYRMSSRGGEFFKLTSKPGGYKFSLSPDEKNFALLYSYTNKPTELYVMPNRLGGKMKQITNSTTKNFQAYKWRVPETVAITASDGAKVPAHLFKPNSANGKAVIFVHGAGYLQNVHSWWSSYFREYMFHNFLVERGYTVLQIDYRGSAGYGRDWRTGIYRHMGGKDLSDHVDAAKYLIMEHGIDSAKVGIYGGSYGGFITLMALFNAPETFKAGAAIRSVTDWAHYNHGYTSNILNTPAEDPNAFKQSSPMYFANGLQGHLLILHGMEDDNVQFQDVVRLSQRLIELEKENWDIAIYPVEPHGFKEASSWTDEYKRIYNWFEENL